MVLSRINKTIEYIDKTKVEEQDKNMKTELYEFDVDEYNQTITIAIGKYNKNKNVLFLPIYLFHNEKFISQIGIFEYEITKENEKMTDYCLLDKDGNIVLERLDKPLFYSFFTKEFCTKYNKQTQKKKIQKKQHVPWISKFMNDNDYQLINTDMDYHGDSDCLFTAIKIALSDVKKYISILSMKNMIVKHITKSIFDMYKKSYDNTEKEMQKLKTYVKDLIERNKYYENKIKNTNERSEKIKLIKEAEDNITFFMNAKRELKHVTTKYKNISFMKGIDTIEQLKSLFTTIFYLDKWGISVLEREMNIKIVLFSQEAYDVGDKYNVLDCNHEEYMMHMQQPQNPDYYILISYLKNDYQLITYRRQCAFDFNSLNDTIKIMIVNKIQERNAGIYASIPEFINYMKRKHIVLKNDPNIQLQSELYSGDTVFQIYENSNDNYEPGKGVGERLDKNEHPDKYKDLRNCESWRRKLYEFSLDIQNKNDEIMNILRNTKNAKIVYFIPNSPPVPATNLMKIRLGK